MLPVQVQAGRECYPPGTSTFYRCTSYLQQLVVCTSW
jgi:hypothetical protein